VCYALQARTLQAAATRSVPGAACVVSSITLALSALNPAITDEPRPGFASHIATDGETMSISERIKAQLAKDQPVTAITLRLPVDVVASTWAIAPQRGFSGYQPPIGARCTCIGEALNLCSACKTSWALCSANQMRASLPRFTRLHPAIKPTAKRESRGSTYR
jgi:hypothetical protein